MKSLLLLSYLVALVYCQIPESYFQKCLAGSYDARIRVRQSMSYTKIPKGVIGLRVLLSAIPYDVDITLMNGMATEWWVYPCSSRKCRSYISSPHAVTANINGLTVSYSGYKGLELTKPGVEWLEIPGELTEDIYLGFKLNVGKLMLAIPLAMRIEWEGSQGCTPAPQEGLDLKILTNTRNHMTYRYRDVPQGTLITRRGLEFIGIVTMNGAKPSNTYILFPDLDDVPGAITVTSVKQLNNNQLSFTVKINSTSPVGSYKLHVESNGKVAEANLVILFNPYLPDTPEYMPDPVLLEENIENEEGIIWQGSNYQLFPAIFKFDQFDYVVLDMSLNLLRRMPIAERSNIVLVSRHLSFAINSDVCYGKWGVDPPPFEEGQPEDGYLCSQTQVCKTPTSWKSMADLARVHLAVGRNRVQYCQCFVYAAVTTAIGRTFGIATRPITNFQSAHDKNGNRAVDRFYNNVSGRLYEIDGPVEESVWNFHVWNEMWMKRADITEEICKDMGMGLHCGDGWQAVDATPQELSEGGSGVTNGEGFYMCGPTAKSMIKANKLHTCSIPELNRESHPRVGCFDNNFLIAEVNANINIWVVNDNDYNQKCYQEGEKCGFPTDPFSVTSTAGQYISTKAPGPISDDCREGWCNSERLDITLTYKNPEPSWSTTARGRVMWAMSGNAGNEVVVGTIPKGSTHIINELGSIYSATGVVASVEGEVGSKLMCTATISALDYRGKYVSKKLNESLIQVMESDSTLTSEKGECRFVITREMYGPFTSSVMSNVAKAVSAKVSLSIRIVSPSGSISDYLEERVLHFCTPKNPMDAVSGEAECAANAGYFEGPERPVCPDGNARIGDGICNDDLNNVENCYDNGDCCDVSCAGRYAGVENNDECPTDNLKCKDPDFQPGFRLPKAEDPEKLETDNIQCSKINNAVKAVVTKACPTNECTPDCQAALVDLICEQNKWEHWKCDTSLKSLAEHKCLWPRCPQKAKPAGQGFNVWGDGHPPVKSSPMELLSKSKFKQLKDAQNNKDHNNQPMSIVPIVLCGLVGSVVGLIIGVVVGKRREIII